MCLTKKLRFVLCLLIFVTFATAGKSERDYDILWTRLMDLEKIVSNQGQVIGDQEARLSNQEKVMLNYEKRLANQEKSMENQDSVMETQEKLISNLMTHLKLEKNKDIDFLKTFEDPSLEDRVNHLEEVAKIKVLRSCAEMEQHGVRTSGFYHLDPDGENIGNPPIRAYCNFEDHVTEILHDADDELINISHCDDNLCYSQDLIYTSHMDQMTSLMQLSTFCDQTIEFDCYMAPLNYGDVQLGVWADRHGEDQIYFDGSNYANHTCSCNKYNNCTGHETLHNSCNCDNTAVPDWMQDAGKLTNMSALPVMGFKYGPLTYETQQAQFRVGRLRCGGMREVSSIPHTCQDLKLLGETRPGLYHLQDAEHGDYPKMSFCELDQPGYGEGMELESDWVKKSSGPGQIYFAVKHSERNDIHDGAVVTFDQTLVNEGDGMDGARGVFTAPVEGVYDFKLSGLAEQETGYTYINVLLNDVHKIRMYDANVNEANSMSRAWAFTLKQGDNVKLVKKAGGFDGSDNGLYFIGMLM